MSTNIAKVDPNFKIDAQICKDGLAFYNADNAPFKIYGIFRENGKYRRLPEAVARSVSDGVFNLHANTAGGRVRFKTDSSRVCIMAKMENIFDMSIFSRTGTAGFDIYIKDEGYRYAGTFAPPENIKDEYESTVWLEGKEMRDITINFPLYSDVKELLIGLDEDAVIEKAPEYTLQKPIVYYGSSITQGGCASRAGNSYQGIVSREFDCDFINLGFAGNAKAEDQMIDYINGLCMSVFVYDYDHNAPSVEHLSATHEKMFKAIRRKHPILPIIIMSRPKYILNDDEKRRLEIIKTTYNNALGSGDKNVYFIDGKTLMAKTKTDGTVDNVHPNDWGFASMAQALADVLKKFI